MCVMTELIIGSISFSHLKTLKDLNMKILTAIFALIIAAEGVSFFDVVLEEWNLYKVGKFLLSI